jgi:NAD(P)-dependent dehydrogenase (short-subunit alcohol dehydrogenase family)
VKKPKVLIVGAGTGGIGDAVAEVLREDHGLFLPGLSTLDVANDYSIEWYVGVHGPFDAIVYSAGYNKLDWISDLSSADYQRTFEINAFGLPLLVAAQHRIHGEPVPRVVAIVSDASDTPMRGSLAYTASKAAEAMIVRGMARELAPGTITVGVSPGVVDNTAMTEYINQTVPGFRGWTEDQARQYEMAGNVLGRRVTKEEVAQTVRFALTGPEALNGSIITLNGGK